MTNFWLDILETVFFDLAEVRDKDTSLPFMLPSESAFKDSMVALGVQRHQQIVVYDASSQGIFTAARVAWMLRYFGATNVRVLNGGLKKWQADGRATVQDSPRHSETYKEEEGDYSFSIVDS